MNPTRFFSELKRRKLIVSFMWLNTGFVGKRNDMPVLHRATPERLSAFSDGVFAVLITVLVLELRPPELPTFKALLSLWPTWLSYAVSYLRLAIGCLRR